MVVVCNAGITSQKACKVLESMGYKPAVLEDGMRGWNVLHQNVLLVKEKDLVIQQIIRLGKGCLSYIVGSNSTNECFIIDPSYYINEYIEAAKKLGLEIKGVIETHLHADHISGAKIISNLTNSKYYFPEKEGLKNNDFVAIKDNDVIKLGNNFLKVIETPGHTEGSVCLLLNEKFLFTGDTLFLDSVGRPDLGQQKETNTKAKMLFNSLEKLKNLDKDVIILPAHFTIGHKKPIAEKLCLLIENNKSLKINSEQEFIDFTLSRLQMFPPNFEQIKSINCSFMKVPKEICEKLEFGPNRCASG